MKVILPWAAPLTVCLAIVLTYLSLSPDAFLLALLLLPFLFIAAVVFTILLIRRTSPTRAAIVAGAWASLVAIPVLLSFGRPFREQIFFQIWRLTHIQEATNPKLRDQVLEHWDSWGFASMDNDTFLASDLDDALAKAVPARRSPTLPEPQASVAHDWGRSHQLRCDIVWVNRVAKGFYVLTTADSCMLS